MPTEEVRAAVVVAATATTELCVAFGRSWVAVDMEVGAHQDSRSPIDDGVGTKVNRRDRSLRYGA